MIARLAVPALTAITAVVVGARTASAATTGTATSATKTTRIAILAAGILFQLSLAAARRGGQAGGFLLEVLGQGRAGQSHPGQPFDVFQVRFFVRRNKAQRNAVGAGPRGAADPVDVLFRHVGHFKVEHVAHSGHVDPARGDIGGDQDWRGPLAEREQRSGALGLALVAMDRGGIDTGRAQMAHNPVSPVLGPGEDQGALDLARFEPLLEADREQRLLFGLVDEHCILLNPFCGGRLRAHFDPNRVVDELLAKIGDRLGHGRAEEQALALLGQHRGDALERYDKAKVHHLVSFVEHENLDIAQGQRALIDQIEQAAGSGDKDVSPADQRAGLLANGQAAEHALDRKVQILGIAAHVLGDLGGELAGRAEHQHPARSRGAALRLSCQAVE